MWTFLVLPAFQPFTIAALVMIGLLATEIVSALFGASVAHFLDGVFNLHGLHVEAGLHHDSGVDHGAGSRPLASAFDWLNAGRVPLLILIVAAIACFAATGLVLQILALNVAAPLPVGAAIAFAVLASVPGTRWTSRLLALVMPGDETYALGDGDLIGRVGTVTLGPVAEGAAARAKIRDQFGNWHFPRIVPGAPGLTIPEGASVLVVDRVGGCCAVIPAEGRLVPEPGERGPA
jgi:hypothetical protein